MDRDLLWRSSQEAVPSGHAKKQVGGLSVSAMNKGFGGEKLR